MFALSQLVDIPHLFRRLDALPRELATARQELWAANIEIGEAQRGYDEVLAIELAQAKEEYAKCKNAEERENFKTLPGDRSDVYKAHGHLLVMQGEQAARKANLADLNDEMAALRMKIDLITALTMGRQETIAANSSLARTLEMMRVYAEQGEVGDPDPPEETVLESVHSIPF